MTSTQYAKTKGRTNETCDNPRHQADNDEDEPAWEVELDDLDTIWIAPDSDLSLQVVHVKKSFMNDKRLGITAAAMCPRRDEIMTEPQSPTSVFAPMHLTPMRRRRRRRRSHCACSGHRGPHCPTLDIVVRGVQYCKSDAGTLPVGAMIKYVDGQFVDGPETFKRLIDAANNRHKKFEKCKRSTDEGTFQVDIGYVL